MPFFEVRFFKSLFDSGPRDSVIFASADLLSLRPLAPRHRYIAGAVIAAVAIALSLGIRKITG